MRGTLTLFGLCVSCASALSPLKPFSFASEGKAVRATGTVNQECTTASTFKSDAPYVALALTNSSDICWSASANNFTVQPGKVGPFKAFQVSGPEPKFPFYAIWLSFDQKGSYKIYQLDDTGSLKELADVESQEAYKFVDTKLYAEEKRTLVVAPASVRVSQWPQLEDGVEGATVWQDSTFKITAHRWDVSVGQPYDPSVSFQKGPSDEGYNYGTSKYFFAVANNNSEGVVWQDTTTSKIFLTWLSDDLLRASHIELATNGISDPILAAAVGNGKGEVLCVLDICHFSFLIFHFFFLFF